MRHSVRKSRCEAGRSESAARRPVTLGPSSKLQISGTRHDLDTGGKHGSSFRHIQRCDHTPVDPGDVGRRCHRRRSVSTIVLGPVKTRWVSSVQYLTRKCVSIPGSTNRSLHDHGPPTTDDAVEAGILTPLPGDSRQSDCRSLLALAVLAFPSPASQVGQEARIIPARATVWLQAPDQQPRFDAVGCMQRAKKGQPRSCARELRTKP